jgi:hypothetical protein
VKTGDRNGPLYFSVALFESSEDFFNQPRAHAQGLYSVTCSAG